MHRPERRVERRCDAVSLRVEVVADLHRIARFTLVVKLVHRRLQQERVLALGVTHLGDSGVSRLDEDVRVAAHERPHLGERRYTRVLRTRGQKNTSSTNAQYTPPTPTRRNCRVASSSAVRTQFATSSRRLPTDSVDNLETG